MSTMHSSIAARVSHDLGGNHPARSVRPRQQPLRHDGPQRFRKALANHLLFRSFKHPDQARDGARRIGRVHGTEHEVAGLGRLQGNVDGDPVAHLADHDDVRILPESRPQCGFEAVGVASQFALDDIRLVVTMEILDRVLDGHHLLRPQPVDMTHHGGQRGALAAAGRAGHQHQAAILEGRCRRAPAAIRVARTPE